MKIRQGFVSNSSSSSFIIGFKKSYSSGHNCPTCGNPTNIFKIIKSVAERSCETEIDAQGFDEIVNRYNNAWDEGKEKEEVKDKLTKFLADKNPAEYELMLLSIDNNDEFLTDLIRYDKNITIIKDGGY